MNQPKFKFGDEVIEENSTPFIVGIIIRTEDGKYLYSDANSKPFHMESRLELYTEPKPRKLFAWSNKYGDIRFTQKEELRTFGEASLWDREAKFDLYYSDKE